MFSHIEEKVGRETIFTYGEPQEQDVETDIYLTIISGKAIENGIELLFDIDGEVKGYG